jgi:hypothetical protein
LREVFVVVVLAEEVLVVVPAVPDGVNPTTLVTTGTTGPSRRSSS